MKAAEPQPKPVPGRKAVGPMVIADMQSRIDAGLERYGRPLETFNGRDALWDAYQEALDLCMYLRQAIEEDKMSEEVWEEFQGHSDRLKALEKRVLLLEKEAAKKALVDQYLEEMAREKSEGAGD